MLGLVLLIVLLIESVSAFGLSAVLAIFLGGEPGKWLDVLKGVLPRAQKPAKQGTSVQALAASDKTIHMTLKSKIADPEPKPQISSPAKKPPRRPLVPTGVPGSTAKKTA